MRRDRARAQLLVLMVMGAVALLSLDVEPIKAAVADYLDEAPVQEASLQPERPRGPGLQGRAPEAPVQEPRTVADAPSAPSEADTVAAHLHPGRYLITTVGLRDDKLRGKLLTGLRHAQRVLRLTPEQAADLLRIMEDARHDLADLSFVRNENGECWHDLLAEFTTAQRGREAHGRLTAAALQLAEFVGTELSGRGENWRSARRRVLDSYGEHAERLLSSEQRLVADRYDLDGLFDESMLIRFRSHRLPTMRTLIKRVPNVWSVQRS